MADTPNNTVGYTITKNGMTTEHEATMLPDPKPLSDINLDAAFGGAASGQTPSGPAPSTPAPAPAGPGQKR